MKPAPFDIPAPFVEACRQTPLIIADVGARGGLQDRWHPVAPHVTWIGFEPDARSVDALPVTIQPGRSHVLPVALSDRQGVVTLHRTRDEGDSSLLRPNRPFLDQFARPERFDVVDTVEMTADTLDAQLAAIGLTTVDVLKLDTQGTELDILRGSLETLRRGVLAVDVEVEFGPLYEEQPLFAEVDRFLRRLELQLMDLAPRRAPYAAGEQLQLARGPIVWAESVYFPTADRLVRELAACAMDERTSRLAKACLVACAYGFPDYALALLARAPSSGHELSTLRAAVEQWDAGTSQPRVPITIDLRPEQLRALRAAQAETGLKPTQQIRKLVQQWLKERQRR